MRELDLEIEQLLSKAEKADSAPLEGCLSIPEEVQRRIERKARLAHHPRRILRIPGPSLVDPRASHIDLLDRIHHEMHQVIRPHPFPQIRGREHRGIVIDVHEARRHAPFNSFLPL